MADLLTLALTATHSNAGKTIDYLVKDFGDKTAIETTPDEVHYQLLEAALTPGSVIGATHFATVNYLIVRNLDGANFVTIEFDDAAADTNTLVIAAGELLIVSDVDPSASITIVADTGVCLCEVLIDGT